MNIVWNFRKDGEGPNKSNREHIKIFYILLVFVLFFSNHIFVWYILLSHLVMSWPSSTRDFLLSLLYMWLFACILLCVRNFLEYRLPFYSFTFVFIIAPQALKKVLILKHFQTALPLFQLLHHVYDKIELFNWFVIQNQFHFIIHVNQVSCRMCDWPLW